MKIAISGAGIAGPALAYWLRRADHEPTLIERAPHFRTGGYVIDFWGPGYRVAQRMGLEDEIRNAGYRATPTCKKSFGLHPLLAFLDRPEIAGGEALAGL